MVTPVEQQNMTMLAQARTGAQQMRRQVMSMRKRGRAMARFRQKLQQAQQELRQLKKNRVKIVRFGLDSLFGVAFIMAILKDIIDFGATEIMSVVGDIVGWIPWVGQILSVSATLVGMGIVFVVAVFALIVIGMCVGTVLLLDPAFKNQSKVIFIFTFSGIGLLELLGFGISAMPGMVGMVIFLYVRVLRVRRRARKRHNAKISKKKSQVKKLKRNLRRFSLISTVRAG